MRSFSNSIKGRLVLWFFLFICLFLLLLGGVLYKEVKTLIFSSVDHLLHSKSQIIKGLLHIEDGRVELELTEIIHGEYSIPRSGHYYKVVMDGDVLAASESLVDRDFDLTKAISSVKHIADNERFYTSIGPAGEPIRVLQSNFDFLGRKTTVYVAHSLQDSLDLLKRLRHFLIIAAPIIILLIGAGGYWIVSISLRPLRLFSQKIEKITHRTLEQRIEEPDVKELKGLAISFNAMLQRLKVAFDIEKRILSDASHELKTPLSVIMAECDVTLQKKRTAEEYKDSLLTIKDKAEMMKKTLDNILNLARLDSGLLRSGEFREFLLSDCISHAIEMVKAFARQKDIDIIVNVESESTIRGDSDRLTEAFLNLLDNAIRYNRKGGSVEVSVKTDSGSIEVSIKDTGMGIDKEDAEKIFDRFFRADSVRNTEGTGLGLSIVKEIIRAHGGEIRLESSPGKGSTFILSFPVSLD